MEVIATKIPDVKLVKPVLHGDHRGYFMESWNQHSFAEAGLDLSFVQDNQSLSRKNTLRGLHYQTQHAQGKLVRILHGEIFDVAVDMRRSSPTFGQWVGERLSAENNHMLWVPGGFAHGFVVLSESAAMFYKCTDFYAPQYEHSLIWNDPEVGIEWPLAEGETPILSAKDEAGLPFHSAATYD